MPPENKRPRSRKKLIVLALATLTIAGLGIFVLASFEGTFARPQMEIDGFLPYRDLVEIRRIVQHETWRGFPRFSASSLREFFEREIRWRWSEHIRQVSVHADGTVQVDTVVKVKWPIGYSYGSIYIFQKDQHGWHITSRGSWQT